MKQLLIIGGGGAGMFSSIVATQLKPRKYKATILSNEKDIYCRCSTPYILTGQATLKDAIQPDSMIKSYGVNLIHEQAMSIDTKNKTVSTKKKTYPYDKLVIASGARAFTPPIPGITKKNSHEVRTSEDVASITKAAKKCKKAVVIGGGVIGIEMAGALTEQGITTTLIEREEQLLPGITNNEQAKEIAELLRKNKITVLPKTNVIQVKDDKKRIVTIENKKGKKNIQAELIIVAAGIKPNTEFAKEASIRMDERGNIIVNNKMRTSNKHIYACGDCTTSKNTMTGEYWPSQLASVAIQQAKIVGYQLASMPMKYHGHTDAFGFKTLGKEYAQVGLDEEKAKKKYKHITVGVAETTNVYKDLKGHEPLRVKLIFAGIKMRLVGAQAYGQGVTGHVEIASLAISLRANVTKLLRYNYLSHPPLTPWPFMNPIIMASEDAMGKMMSKLKKKPIIKWFL